MPHKSIISKLLGASPVRPLQLHMEKVHACAMELIPFFAAVIAEDWPQAEQVREHIVALEGEADAMKRQLRLKLPSTLMLAVSRRDLLDVLYRQDQIANMARDISGLVMGRKLRLPDCLRENYPVFLARCLDATSQATTTINELDELVELGFRGGEVQRVEEMIAALDAIERDSDRMQVTVRACLLEVERELYPVDVVFLYQLISWTGDLADHAQKVGTRVELMLAR